MADPFEYSDSVQAPARKAVALTPHDVNALATTPKALFIGTGGNVTLRAIDSAADVVLKNLANGQVIDVRAQYVRATGTTATDIVALY